MGTARRSLPQLEVDTFQYHVHVWGGFVWDDGAVFPAYRGHLTALTLTDLLEEHPLPHKENLRNRVFLLDRASSDTAKLTRAWLESHDLIWKFLPSPSNSTPSRDAGPGSSAGLEAAVEAAWTDLPLDVIDGHLRNAQRSVRMYAEANASSKSL